ncbi:Pentatricopeptide repeat-containing protein [Platanthera guangdongensis]|uniref:Pentatricopeptide repeat-containing protein n=1 Tax=Platanthera guangdongensis TaxID=2320717 RepID=A0ABR2MX01_9ASPA
MPHRDIISWNAVIAAHRIAGDPLKSFHRFLDMLRLSFRPTCSTLATIISASPPAAISQLHAAVLQSGHHSNTIVGTALVGGYTAGGNLAEARLHFDAVENRNAFTWTVMVAGYLRRGCFSDALCLFAAAPRPNPFACSAALAASAGLCSLRCGESIHAQILKGGTPLDAALATALVDMYGRCGEADKAADSSAGGSVAAWNAMIGAMGRNGRSAEATEGLRGMTAAGLAPDGTTFVHVLSACAHGGLIEEGRKIFGAMEREFRVRAGKEHYGCMVDMYGRAGMKEEAELAAEAMPEEMGAGGYALMARVYGERGKWEKVKEMKRRMEDAKHKQRGASWVESMANCIL